MVVELAAVRLLAPWFGTSLVVWTNVIAVVLLALALGYLLGGRLAAGAQPVSVLSGVLLAAGSMIAWLPFLAATLSRSLLPDRIELAEAAGVVGWGSLAVSLSVFLPPALLLGSVCPLVVEALARARHLSAGGAGGSVLFVSTLGSLVGVFGTSHFLLPELGIKQTYLLASALLLVCAGFSRFLVGASGASGIQGVLLIGWIASIPVTPRKPVLAEGMVELERRESSYQTLRVVEDRTQGAPLRYLQVNEGFDSFQSVWQAELGLLPTGFYYNDFLIPFSWSDASDSWRVLALGLGAGTVVRVLSAETRLQSTIIGVELDPVVTELGRSYFDLPEDGARLTTWTGMDGRVALRVTQGEFDQIVLDCYANQVEIPPHLCTVEFFRDVRQRLAEGGWLTANLGGFNFDDPVVTAVAASCALAFEEAVLLIRVPCSRNYMLIARRGGALPWSKDGLLPAAHPSLLQLGPRRLPGFVRRVEPAQQSGTVLTDDHCPIEALQFQSIEDAKRWRRTERGA